MKPIFLAIILIAMITLPALANSPPTAPSIPSGLTSVTAGTSYGYYVKATDPDGNSLKYTLDWGDG